MAKPKKTIRYEYSCSGCGGKTLTFTANVSWNVDKQDWEYGSVLDTAFCHDCGEEVSYSENIIGGE